MDIRRCGRNRVSSSRRWVAVLSSFALTLSTAVMSYAATPSDEEISTAIESELLFHPEIPYNQVDISTVDGIVTVEGKVPSLLAKNRTVRIAESMRGVRSVVDHLEVKETSKADSEVAQAVKSELAIDPITEDLKIDVDAKQGVVTLQGPVDSWQEMRGAILASERVMGVQQVVNNIRVRKHDRRVDSEITEDVLSRLKWDVFVDSGLIDVDVKRGRVKLSGKVGSPAEKRRAEQLAWVAGVRAIDATGLEVMRDLEDKQRREKAFVIRDDDQIKKAVEDAMLYDPRVASTGIKTNVVNGFVTLTGTVPNLEAKRAAVQDAQNTLGVGMVYDDIRLLRPADITDEKISTHIGTMLMNNPFVDSAEVNVRVKNGRVKLNGIVDNYFEKAEAEQVASRVKGVTVVQNNLDVRFRDIPLAYNPYLDDWTITQFEWYSYEPLYALVSDAELKNKVRSELFWSPFVDSDDIDVDVSLGTVTLEGTVESAAAARTAEQNALEAGAPVVINKLVVE